MATFTLTGTLEIHSGVPRPDVHLEILGFTYPDAGIKVVYLGETSVVTDANGSFTTPLTVLAGSYYVVRGKNRKHPLRDPITNAAFEVIVPSQASGSTHDISEFMSTVAGTVTPSVLSDALAARDVALAAQTAASASATAAAASAASVNREASGGVAGLDAAGLPIRAVPKWRASTAVAIGDIWDGPEGSRLQRVTTGPSRSAFDATEQGAWSPVVTTANSIEKLALDKAYRHGLSVFDFGAKGDGTTDDTTALTNWLAALGAFVKGGRGYLPRGTYKTLAQLVVPHQVTIVGEGLGSIIIAGTGFPAATALMSLGDPSGAGPLATGTLAMDMVLDCNTLATQGVYSRAIQENSGLKTVVVKNYTDKGIYIKIPAQNFSLDDLFVLSAASATASWGINIESVTWFRLNRVTIDTNGTNKQTQPGVAMNGSSGAITQLHVESQDAGILFYNGGGGFAATVSGSDLNKLVQIGTDASDRISLHNLFPGTGGTGVTTTLLDQRNGLSIAGTTSMSSYQGGRAYFAPSDTNGVQARPTVTTARGFVFRGLASHTGEAFRVEDSGGNRLFNVNGSDGGLTWGSAADLTLKRIAAGVLGVGTGHTIRTGVDITANRPSAATVGRGSQFYDQTLNKPIWSDGTNWRDAAGTVV